MKRIFCIGILVCVFVSAGAQTIDIEQDTTAAENQTRLRRQLFGRQFPKYYVGVSGKVTTSTLGDRTKLILNNTKWIGQIYFGIKLR